jgi:3-hydroxyacyl-[acyl-carrier-protein] dehydratase
MTMDVKEIMRYLPHRYPFLLVDRIVSFEKDSAITGIKNVTFNEEFFQGHFPGNPIMPGVLIVEAMAQTAGILAIKSSEREKLNVYFMSIESAKFRKPVVPGDSVIMDIKVLRRRGNVWKLSGKASVDDKVVSEADFTAMMTEMEI